jgi:mono/diheme cytochrome c family protein
MGSSVCFFASARDSCCWVREGRSLIALVLTLPAAAVVGSGCAGGGEFDASGGDAERGREVFALAGGCGCHTPEKGPVGAGGRALETPFGTFHPTNITSDRENGIGAWSDEEVEAAIRDGVLRDGSVEAPVMPYYRYAGMSDEDVRDLIAYLRTLAPSARPNRPHEVDLPLPRLAFRAWRLLFAPDVEAPAVAPAAGVERGRYLSDHVSICGDCHTPRDRFGAPDHDLHLAGVEDGPLGEVVPNITSDEQTGIGKWDVSDIESLLEMGMLPDFDNVQGLMAEVVDGIGGGPGYAQASKADRRAIAEYIHTVPPIAHRIEGEEEGS